MAGWYREGFKRRHTSCASRAKTSENTLLRVVYSERVIALQFEMSVEVSETLFQIFCCSSFPESQPWYLDLVGKDAVEKSRLAQNFFSNNNGSKKQKSLLTSYLVLAPFNELLRMSSPFQTRFGNPHEKNPFPPSHFLALQGCMGPRNIWLPSRDRKVIRYTHKKSLALPRWNLPYPAIWKG